MSRNTWLILSLSILPPALLAADVCLGSVFIPLRSIMDGDSMQAQILLNLRLPKAITAILAGAALVSALFGAPIIVWIILKK